MQISINIDDEKLTALVKKGIEEIDRESLGKVVNEALKTVFTDPVVVKKMMFECSRDYYGKEQYGAFQAWVQEVIAAAITPEDLEEFKKPVIDTVREHGRDMLMKVLADTFAKTLFTENNQVLLKHEIYDLLYKTRRTE